MPTEIGACHPGLKSLRNMVTKCLVLSNSDDDDNYDVNNINIIQCNTKGGWK